VISTRGSQYRDNLERAYCTGFRKNGVSFCDSSAFPRRCNRKRSDTAVVKQRGAIGGAMSLVGLSEAARLARKDKATIHRALKSGRLCYSVTESGERRIDTTELDRVFPIMQPNGESEVASPVAQRRREVEQLHRQLDDRDEVIRDLRRRLDESETERRSVQAQLNATVGKMAALLAAPAAAIAPDQPRPLSRRILAWLVKQHV